MADAFVDTARAAGKPARAHESSGVNLRFRSITFEIAATAAAGDVNRLFTVGAHEIPVECIIMCDALTGATDMDLGFYRPAGGAVVDKDALMDGTNISGGLTYANQTDGLSALDIVERGVKSMFEIANDVETTDVIGHLPNDSYDIALTQNSEISGAGTVTVHLWTIDEQ
jgi:hypothetical protein